MAKINGKNIGDIPGTIKAWGNGTAPLGYFVCDGRSLSQTQYAGLFAKIGTSFGDGSTGTVYGTPGGLRFNLPDLRGRFLRGADGTAGNDPDKASRTAMATGGATGNSVGSVQGDAVLSHRHWISSAQRDDANGTGMMQNTQMYGLFADAGSYSPNDPGYVYGRNSAYDGGNESRPKNAYVNYIIKH